MKRTAKPLIIAIISAISLILLVLVIVFADSSFFDKPTGVDSSHVSTDIPVTLTLDSDTVVYNGEGKLDFMEGVHAFDNKGNDITEYVSASVADSKSGGKIISYSINKYGYEFTQAERRLEISNYSRPSITLNSDELKMDLSDKDIFIKQLISQKLLSADDGFGHDISSGIYSNDFNDIISSGSYTLTLSVENFLHDSAEITVPITVTGEIPGASINLSTTTVSIPVNSSFDPMDYVVAATDSNGNDVTHLVKTDNPVDISAPGQYTVTYSINSESGYSTTASLTVVVG